MEWIFFPYKGIFVTEHKIEGFISRIQTYSLVKYYNLKVTCVSPRFG